MKLKVVFSFLSILLLLFLIVPVFRILASLPLDQYLQSLKDSSVVSSILLSLKMSMYATILVVLTGVPLAYILARVDFPLKGVVEGLIDIPVMIPHVAAGIALLMVFEANGVFGEFFKSIGITFLDTEYGILIAMMFVSAPFLINSAKEGFKKVDERLEFVSRSLGVGPLETFFKVTLPLARKDIINGALMMWGRGIGEFGAVVIIAYHPMTAPVTIYDRFNSFGLNYALPITALMILISILIFVVIRVINNIIK